MAEFTPITRAAFDAGAKAGGELRPHASSVRFDRKAGRIVLALDTGIELSFDPKAAYGLDRATDAELDGVEIVGAGGAIHFPALNELFSIPKLLEGFLGPLAWSRREARSEASRRNGALGGRPRKIAGGASG